MLVFLFVYSVLMALPPGRHRYLVEPFIVFNHSDRLDILRVYFQNYHRIRSSARLFATGNANFNFELLGDQPVSATDLTRNVFDSQRHAFRINASCGFILYNNRTQQARYFWPCWNNAAAFDNTPFVQSRSDWNELAEQLSSAEFLQDISAPRDNSEETVVWITQLYIWTYPLHNEVLV